MTKLLLVSLGVLFSLNTFGSCYVGSGFGQQVQIGEHTIYSVDIEFSFTVDRTKKLSENKTSRDGYLNLCYDRLGRMGCQIYYTQQENIVNVSGRITTSREDSDGNILPTESVVQEMKEQIRKTIAPISEITIKGRPRSTTIPLYGCL